MAKGLLFMAFDFSNAHEDEFHDWYDREHGGVIQSEAWSRATNTPWSQRMQPKLRDVLILRSDRYQRKA